MTYDVTYHPVAVEEVGRYVLPILHGNAAGIERLQTIAPLREEKRHLLLLAEHLLESYALAAEWRTLGRVAYDIAVVCGYLHPYWWGLGTTFRNLPGYADRYAPLIRSVAVLSPELFGHIEERDPGQLTQNETGGGYVPAENVAPFRRLLAHDARSGAVDIIDYACLILALEYAERHGTGILEADGIYDRRACATEIDNMRTKVVRDSFPYLAFSIPGGEEDIPGYLRRWAAEGPEAYRRFMLDRLPAA